jgi:hypothetical protein
MKRTQFKRTPGTRETVLIEIVQPDYSAKCGKKTNARLVTAHFVAPPMLCYNAAAALPATDACIVPDSAARFTVSEG